MRRLTLVPPTQTDPVLHALDQGLGVLEYQPVVRSDGGVVFHEALLRLTGPDFKLIMPDVFLPIVTETGLLPELDCLAMNLAISQLQNHPCLRLSVNVHPHSLSSAQVMLRAAMLSRDVAMRLIVEVTEQATPCALGQATLNAFRTAGAAIYADDFGAGATSLRLLSDGHFDGFKIDRSFIERLESSDADQAICRALLDLADMLGVMVVAEGVETPAQAEWLRSAHAPMMQGYFFGKPAASPQPYGYETPAFVSSSLPDRTIAPASQQAAI